MCASSNQTNRAATISITMINQRACVCMATAVVRGAGTPVPPLSLAVCSLWPMFGGDCNALPATHGSSLAIWGGGVMVALRPDPGLIPVRQPPKLGGSLRKMREAAPT